MEFLYYILYLIAIGFTITMIVLLIELRKQIKAQRKGIPIKDDDTTKNV